MDKMVDGQLLLVAVEGGVFQRMRTSSLFALLIVKSVYDRVDIR